MTPEEWEAWEDRCDRRPYDWKRLDADRRLRERAMKAASGLEGLEYRSRRILMRSAPPSAVAWSTAQWQDHVRALDVAGLREVGECGPISLHDIAQWMGGVFIGSRFCFGAEHAQALLEAEIARIHRRIEPEIAAARQRYALRVERLRTLKKGNDYG